MTNTIPVTHCVQGITVAATHNNMIPLSICVKILAATEWVFSTWVMAGHFTCRGNNSNKLYYCLLNIQMR